MNRPLIAERFYNQRENLLMEIATSCEENPKFDWFVDWWSWFDYRCDNHWSADVKAGHTKYTASDGFDFIQTVVDFYQKQYQLTFL